MISRNIGDQVHKLFSGVTTGDGVVRVTNLPPGDYWLGAELLGIYAGTECFHVGTGTKASAKKRLSYEWGEFAPATSKIAGGLVDSQPSQDGTPLWKLTHQVDTPIAGAKLRLQEPLTGVVYRALSNAKGQFSFGPIPNGTYVLHVDGGTVPGGREYGPTDQIVRLRDTAKANAVTLTWRPPFGGSCGGTYLEIQQTEISLARQKFLLFFAHRTVDSSDPVS